MNLKHTFFDMLHLPWRLNGAFNLNDPQWGRKTDTPDTPDTGVSQDAKRPNGGAQPDPAPQAPNNRRGQKPEDPPDLDEIWNDFNKKLGGLFSDVKNGKKIRPLPAHGNGGNGGNGSGPGGVSSDGGRNVGIGLGVIAVVAVLIWLGTGFFIVQEGQQAVITQFGKYNATVGAGFNWRLPYPIQQHELIFVTQIRSVDVGRDTVIKATGLRESAMLTEDENIVEIKFAVQYRLSDARAFLFESKNPTEAVVQAAETAVREVIGKMRMDSALSDERDQIAPRVRALMQTILDRYKVGIEVVGVNLQQGGVRPPEQVQAAFDDVLKAGQERERSKNEAQAYANDVIPRAVGAAARLKEEADAYKSRIVAQAQGDAQRFRSVLDEYQKAPQVTRDRMYIDAMQQVYSSVTKVLVDSRQGGNLLYLPLDKIMRMTSTDDIAAASATPPNTAGNAPAVGTDVRARDAAQPRNRDIR